nr:CPBP family intramembrane metalloprotease [Clostridium amazonitimonense]
MFYCIFLGFVYMKTRNLWSVIIIHLINNYLAIDATNSYETVITSKDLVLSLILNLLIFLPFLFTKEYKGDLTIEEFKNSL